MRRLFLDANVLFSAAHKPDSAQGLLIDFAERQLIHAVSSAYALDEALRNLTHKSPDVVASQWPRIVASIQASAEPNAELLSWASTIVVAKDAPILACAVRAQVDWLVTGDRRDFGHLFSTIQRGVVVVPPAEAIRRLLSEFDEQQPLP